MTRINSDRTVAVSEQNEWQPMETCPRGVRVWVLGKGGCATTEVYDGKNPFWLGWFDYPKTPDWMKT